VFSLLLLCGLMPLVVVDYLLVSAAPRDGRLLETGAIVAGSALLLVVLAWILSGWAAAAVVDPARRLSDGLSGLAQGRFETWVSPMGGVQEMADLSDELNRMSAQTLETVRKLEQSGRDNAELATDAMRLFQQAVQAKEPLTKHHPGLLEAYSKAVARQMGDRGAEGESLEILLSPFSDPEQKHEPPNTRSQPRYEVDDLRVHTPVGAKILDVNSRGMGLETMERLPLGRQDTFMLVARSRRVRVPGHVAWCRIVRTVKTSSGDQMPVFRAGVRFDESFSTSARDELLEIIHTHRKVA
jgi:hypothetical protein